MCKAQLTGSCSLSRSGGDTHSHLVHSLREQRVFTVTLREGRSSPSLWRCPLQAQHCSRENLTLSSGPASRAWGVEHRSWGNPPHRRSWRRQGHALSLSASTWASLLQTKPRWGGCAGPWDAWALWLFWGEVRVGGSGGPDPLTCVQPADSPGTLRDPFPLLWPSQDGNRSGEQSWGLSDFLGDTPRSARTR